MNTTAPTTAGAVLAIDFGKYKSACLLLRPDHRPGTRRILSPFSMTASSRNSAGIWSSCAPRWQEMLQSPWGPLRPAKAVPGSSRQGDPGSMSFLGEESAQGITWVNAADFRPGNEFGHIHPPVGRHAD